MASPVPEGALFEALNAKKLSPSEIAASFVPSAQYDQLVGPDHSYLVGPRGSGKTTLLRMLEGDALMSWEHKRAGEYRRRVRYSSVFLPADRLWATQIGNGAQSTRSAHLGVAAFGTQMLYALLETLKYRLSYNSNPQDTHMPAIIEHRSEVELVKECAEAWRLKVRAASILSLQAALDLRLLNIAEMIESKNFDFSKIDERNEWVESSPLSLFRFGISAINRHTNQPNHRWGLLLDEMELAPGAIHSALTDNLRGGDRNLVVKLSFSPFDRYIGAQQVEGGPVADHDFKPIYLWYGSRLGGRRFTGGLWKRMVTERSEFRSAHDVLGPSKIDVSSGSGVGRGSYTVGSKQIELIREVSERDISLRKYLVDHHLDLNTPEDLSYKRRSATLRKIYPLVVFRDALLEYENGIPVRRPRRKVTECFTGVDAVFAALEGNPRWIKAVFSRMLSAYEGTGRVNPGLQYDILSDAADRFESLLRVLSPDSNLLGKPDRQGPEISVLELLDKIAKYFSERNLGEFSADPPSVFKVDSSVEPKILSALETALSAGAVIHLRGKQSPPVLPSLTGERFRLAYLLTMREGKEIPFRIGKTVSLSKILDNTENVNNILTREKSLHLF